MKYAIRNSCVKTAVAFLLCAATLLGAAQDYPARPITLIYTSPPGSATELAFRAISTEAGRLLGRPIVVEHRTGANGRLGAIALMEARERTDGRLLTVGFDALMVHQPLVDPSFKFAQGKDYIPVSLSVETALVASSSKFQDVKSLVSYARANPGKLNVAYTPGAITNFLAEMFKQAAAIDVALIPYKGNAQTLPALLSGEVDFQFSVGMPVRPHMDSGKIFGLGTTGGKRLRLFPNVPTFAESGIPVTASIWFGIIGPVGTSADVVSQLNSAFNAALKAPDVAKRLEGNDYSPFDLTPAEFSKFIKSEIDVWTPIIRKANIRMQ